MNVPPAADDASRARVMLVVLSVLWGINWPVLKIGLADMTPWTFRTIGFVISAATLFTLVRIQGRPIEVPRPRDWPALIGSSLLNVVAFGLFSTFAQLTAATSRVAVVTYSFPVWASFLAWLVLGERLGAAATAALALCIGGLAVLVYPVLHTDALFGLGLSVACAITWAIATVYLKLVRIPGDLLSMTAWQVAFAALVLAAATLAFQGPPVLEMAATPSVAAVIFNGIVGTGIAYFIWFRIVERLPAATASLGMLAVPPIGVLGSAIILGERPSGTDLIGFAMIFAAAACVILQPRAQAAAPRR